MLTKDEKREKRNWFLFILGYFAGGYLFLNWINQFRTYYCDVAFSFETSIPFIPAFIYGYILDYFCVILLYLFVNNINDFRRLVVSFLSVTTVHYILFLLFPVRNEMRLAIDTISGFGSTMTNIMFYIDKPYNLFPSLHVAYPVLATLILWKIGSRLFYFYVPITILIAISVILVKQHYAADVAVGGGISIVLFKLVMMTERYWVRLFTPSSV